MTRTRMSEEYAAQVRQALMDRVRGADPVAAPAPRRPSPRLVLALAIAAVLIVPAVVFALTNRPGSTPAGGGYTIATDPTYRYDPRGDYAGFTGPLSAVRDGDRACFRVSARAVVGGEQDWALVLPSGWSAGPDLELLDPSGAVAARPGDRVTVYSTPEPVSAVPAGCTAGPAYGALHVERAGVEPVTSTPAEGCAAAGGTVPSGAVTAPVGDVDGDGRADTGWAVLDRVRGGIRFGVRTASGATIGTEQEYASGADRTVSIARLGDGRVVALPSDGRSVELFTLADCTWSAAEGVQPDPESGNAAFAFGTGWGDPLQRGALCLGGELFARRLTSRASDAGSTVAPVVWHDDGRVSIGAYRAVPGGLDQPAALNACAPSAVLRP